MTQQDVVQTLRRQRAEQSEQEAVNSELSLRQLEIIAEGEFGYRQEVTTNIDHARTAAETARDRADAIREHAGVDSALTPQFRSEIDARLQGMEFTLKQQQELHEFAEVYGLDPDEQAYQVAQIEAAIQALKEWIDKQPKPNRAERRARNTAEAKADAAAEDKAKA